MLTKAREISNESFLRATAAAFRESWRIVDVLRQLKNDDKYVSQTQAEDVVFVDYFSLYEESITDTNTMMFSFHMFELNMDEYLDEEVETIRQSFETIIRDWDRKVIFGHINRIV